MTQLSQNKFLQTIPQYVILNLPNQLQKSIQVRQPWRWLVQLHFGEPRLHYEISKASRQKGWELGFHCETQDKNLNRFLLDGFRRNLFEIKDTLGERFDAEMWDRGWTKIYEVYPEEPLTNTFQIKIGNRMAEIISCLHPIFIDLRSAVRAIHR